MLPRPPWPYADLTTSGLTPCCHAVKFVMNDEGRIVDISVVETSANDSATRACVNAITDRAPYGPWTDEMRVWLGSKQEITFTFYYQ